MKEWPPKNIWKGMPEEVQKVVITIIQQVRVAPKGYNTRSEVDIFKDYLNPFKNKIGGAKDMRQAYIILGILKPTSSL